MTRVGGYADPTVVAAGLPSAAAADVRHAAAHSSVLDEQLEAAFRDRHQACLRAALHVTRDPSLAEEVVQEAFIAAWQHAPARFDQAKGSLSTWLLALTRHKAIDAVRRAEHVQRVRATELALATSRHAVGADETVLAGRTATLVRAAVQELTADQRRTVLLAYWGGMTQSEIARRDQTPVGTVKTRSRAALGRLRELLPDRDLL